MDCSTQKVQSQRRNRLRRNSAQEVYERITKLKQVWQSVEVWGWRKQLLQHDKLAYLCTDGFKVKPKRNIKRKSIVSGWNSHQLCKTFPHFVTSQRQTWMFVGDSFDISTRSSALLRRGRKKIHHSHIYRNKNLKSMTCIFIQPSREPILHNETDKCHSSKIVPA